MSKITRIAYNSADWKQPTGDARNQEVTGTYNHEHGFGHEDWLFRSDWIIDGWRYAFIQGVNKSHAKLVKEGQPVDLTLFTIQPDKQRRYVASIRDVECLDDLQADEALKEFQRRGWYDTMVKEIDAIGGNVSALGDVEWARHVLNVRFRLENVELCRPEIFAKEGDPVLRLMRYQLYDTSKVGKSAKAIERTARFGYANPPNTTPFWRSGTKAQECTPEHARIQTKLIEELKTEFPEAAVVWEKDFIDVSVRTGSELLLFEIKSDLEPRTVIRQALGQILEYAYHPARQHDLPLRLFIVGRRPLSKSDSEYFKRLNTNFSLPIEYRVVDL